MIKAAFFDIDGTLLPFGAKQVPESTRSAIEQLQARGIQCVVATGRRMGGFEKLPVCRISFDGYIMLNGQMVYDRQKRLIRGVPITGAAKEFLLDCFDRHLFPSMIVEEYDAYVNYISDHVDAVSRWLGMDNPPIGVYQGGEIYQIDAYLRPDEENLLDPIRDECVLTRWHFGGMDIIGKGGGKVSGIRSFLEENGILPEETIAFGDGENDRQMLSFAGIGVAMGNAEACAKQCADYITTDAAADGIAHALKHFGLIE